MDLMGRLISLMIPQGYVAYFLFFSKNVIIRHKQEGQRFFRPADVLILTGVF